MNPAKIKHSEFIAGYVYKSIEYNCATNTNVFKEIPDDGYKNELVFPKVWIGGDYRESIDSTGFRIKMEGILTTIEQVFNNTFNSNTNHLKLHLNWGESDAAGHVAIQYRLVKDRPKKMTVQQVEEALGYRIEIVSDTN